MHADGVRLHDGSIAVAVHDEPRQAVALAVYEAANVCRTCLRALQLQSLSQLIGFAQTLVPESLVDSLVLEREHTYGY